MISLKLTSEGDIDVTGNTFSLIEGADQIVQKLQTILSIKKGEWFRSANSGLRHDNIIGKDINIEKARVDVVEALNQEPRVLQVEDVTVVFDKVTRITTITFRATTSEETVEGEVTV